MRSRLFHSPLYSLGFAKNAQPNLQFTPMFFNVGWVEVFRNLTSTFTEIRWVSQKTLNPTYNSHRCFSTCVRLGLPIPTSTSSYVGFRKKRSTQPTIRIDVFQRVLGWIFQYQHLLSPKFVGFRKKRSTQPTIRIDVFQRVLGWIFRSQHLHLHSLGFAKKRSTQPTIHTDVF